MDHPPLVHGGNLAAAMRRFGGQRADWLDLSTGINAAPYPVGPLSADAWTRLPGAVAEAALVEAARHAYGAASAAVVATPGAQALIQLVPRLRKPGRVGIVWPTYEEHGAAFRTEGWTVERIPDPADGFDALVVVNPNNPDGRSWEPEALLRVRTGLLIVDESFADPDPSRSLAAAAGREGLVVMRSFGKFYGLAGVRLGFALCAPADAARLTALQGPWAVCGPALEIGAAALADDGWAALTRARLARDAARLDGLADRAGWRLVGGTALFRTYDAGDATAAQERLARARIWTRAFPYESRWLRLGLPGHAAGWVQLERAMAG
jgi:cobalamin biosynthetic protein CobC